MVEGPSIGEINKVWAAYKVGMGVEEYMVASKGRIKGQIYCEGIRDKGGQKNLTNTLTQNKSEDGLYSKQARPKYLGIQHLIERFEQFKRE